MKVKRKEQDIYTPLSWCDRMNSAYQMSIRNSVSAEAILDILTAPSTDSQQELQKRKNGIFSFLKPNAKVNTFLKGLPNSELFDALESMAVIKKWSWNKQVFRLDNDFVHELLNTEEVFYEKDSWKFLPYQLFYLDIEDCPEYCEMFSCQGIFVYVHNLFEDGKEKVVIRIYRVNQDMFIKDMFELGNVSDQLGFCNLSDTKEEIYLSNGEEKKITSNIRGLMTMVVQILNYLSSVQPDIEENPQTKKTYRKPAPHTEPKTNILKFRNGTLAFGLVQLFVLGKRARKYRAKGNVWNTALQTRQSQTALQKGSLVALLVWQRREQSKKSEVAERVLCWRKNRRNASGNT